MDLIISIIPLISNAAENLSSFSAILATPIIPIKGSSMKRTIATIIPRAMSIPPAFPPMEAAENNTAKNNTIGIRAYANSTMNTFMPSTNILTHSSNSGNSSSPLIIPFTPIFITL